VDGRYVRSQELPIFLAHGYVPTEPNVVLSSLFGGRDPVGLHYFDKANLDGIECVVIRTEPTAGRSASSREFWVDPARNGAVLRAISKSKQRLISSVDIRYEETPDGWLPHSWVCYEYWGEATISQRFQFTIKRRVLDPPPCKDDFVLARTAGILVEDYRGESRQLFRVGKDGSTLIPVPDWTTIPGEG
jgi:hypothetical protein